MRRLYSPEQLTLLAPGSVTRHCVHTAPSSVNLQEIAIQVLKTQDPLEKADITRETWHRLETTPAVKLTGETQRLVSDADRPVGEEEKSILKRIQQNSFDEEKTNGLDSLVHNDWNQVIDRQHLASVADIPEFPGRPEKPVLVKGRDYKRPKVPIPVYILHAVAHIEVNAIGTEKAWVETYLCDIM